MVEMTSHQFGDVPEGGFAKEKTRLALQNSTRVVLRNHGEKSHSVN